VAAAAATWRLGGEYTADCASFEKVAESINPEVGIPRVPLCGVLTLLV
jgi:hypothetical protein